MEITRETVEHYAKLANLQLNHEETNAMANQLGDILGFVEKISELDLSDTPTTNVFDTVMPVREDESKPSLGAERALANAPDFESGHFLVPKVISVKS